MSTKVLIKLVSLLTALTCTLVAIFWLNQGHMSQFWTSLGFKNQHLNWCEERVSSLYFYEQNAKLYEKSGEWFWQGQTEIPLDYLRVEKWFAQYCQIPFEKVEAPLIATRGIPVFEALFLDNERLTLYTDTDGTFRFRDEFFKSETLRQAIKELLAFAPKIE